MLQYLTLSVLTPYLLGRNVWKWDSEILRQYCTVKCHKNWSRISKTYKSKHDKEHQVVFQQYLSILTQYKEVIQFLSLEAFCFIFILFIFNFDVQKFFSKKYSIYSPENQNAIWSTTTFCEMHITSDLRKCLLSCRLFLPEYK